MGTADSDGTRVGIDLVRIADIGASIDRFGLRFLQRVFTGLELSQCDWSTPTGVASLAARFAGKEAALKVLRPDDQRPGWQTMEIESLRSGACVLHFRGPAAALAAAAGITGHSISLTHEAEYAAAVVFALCAGREVLPASSGTGGVEAAGPARPTSTSVPISRTRSCSIDRSGQVGLLVDQG